MPLLPFPTLPSVISLVHEDWEIEDPVAEMTMENGFVDARPIRSQSRVSLMREVFTLNATDSATLLAFLRGQRLRGTPFTYSHPIMIGGTGTVRLKNPKLPGRFFIQGSPNWYTITLELEQQL